MNALVFSAIALTTPFCLSSFSTSRINRFIPDSLLSLPNAVENELIVSYQILEIPTLPYCYNPAYIPDDDNQAGTLIVRKDDNVLIHSENRKMRKSFLYTLRIDNQLQILSKPKRLKTQNEFSEDPRGIRLKNTNAIIFNENPNVEKYNRHMVVLETDKRANPIAKHIPQLQNTKVEKNWTPFFDQTLQFIYSFTPYTVITFNKGFNAPPSTVLHKSHKLLTEWEYKWGTPRGGTQAIKIGDKYLAIFHSSFIDTSKRKRWFLMGAILFNDTYPYEPVKISPYPIFAKQLYVSDRSPTAPRKKLVLYPSGIQLLDSRNLIRLFCGVNDSKVLALDIHLEHLLESLTNL
jgi:hypothetical protein